MNILERLQAARGETLGTRYDTGTDEGAPEAPPAPVTPWTSAPAVSGPSASPSPFASQPSPSDGARREARLSERLQAGASAAPATDALGGLKASATTTLFERLGARLSDPDLDDAALQAMVVAELNRVVEESRLPLTAVERKRLIGEVKDDVLGFGPLEPLLADPTITEVMVNGPDSVYVEIAGRINQVPVRFDDEKHLRRVIDRIITRVGRRIDESSPLVDARLADGSRVNAIIPPLAFSGSTLTIRKFSAEAMSVADLENLGTLSPEIAELLQACVQARLNVLISGGTGTGKTTLLNVLSSFIPQTERIITIEDAVELKLQQEHLVRLESRPPNVEGKGEVTIRDLVRNALRMRPDRIVVGEVRGAEALDMLQAMNTGHDGSLTTVHANSARDAMSRLETLVLMAGMELPLRAIREQIAAAIDVVIQLARLRDGTRRIVGINEVHGMEGQTITMQDIFTFDYSPGLDSAGRFLGKTVPTGVRPLFVDRFHYLGIKLSPRVFGAADVWTRR